MVEPQQTETMPEATTEGEPECAHHWQIETPAGKTSEGTCKRCGATRTFYNSSEQRAVIRTAKTATRRDS
jgi:hypothetical protein